MVKVRLLYSLVRCLVWEDSNSWGWSTWTPQASLPFSPYGGHRVAGLPSSSGLQSHVTQESQKEAQLPFLTQFPKPYFISEKYKTGEGNKNPWFFFLIGRVSQKKKLDIFETTTPWLSVKKDLLILHFVLICLFSSFPFLPSLFMPGAPIHLLGLWVLTLPPSLSLFSPQRVYLVSCGQINPSKRPLPLIHSFVWKFLMHALSTSTCLPRGFVSESGTCLVKKCGWFRSLHRITELKFLFTLNPRMHKLTS